jgi:hypothetical protein
VSGLYNLIMRKLALQGILVILVIVILWIGISSVNRSIANIFSPLKQSSDSMSTQVANFLHPTPTILPDPVSIIHEIRSLARLETIQYTIEKVITATSGNKDLAFLFEDRLLLVAHGIVIAGVDLEKLGPGDLKLENGVLMVNLPTAEIFLATLANGKTYIHDRDTGLLRQPVTELETLARQTAEVEIRKAAVEDGILTTAQLNAEAYLTRLFLSMGYADVIFTRPSQ